MISAHRSTILGFFLGAFIVSVAILAMSARADVATAGPGVDPVVASDHALRTVATVAPADAPDPPPSVLDRALDIAGPVGRLALAGIAAVIAARLLAWQRAKRRWLRRRWVGNAAGACYAALVAFGGVLARGGSVASGLVAVGGVTLYGLGLASDPETARVKREASGEDAPT